MEYGSKFYVQVDKQDYYTFYYNMTRQVNQHVVNTVGNQINMRYISDQAYRSIMQNGGLLSGWGAKQDGILGNLDQITGEIIYESALNLDGICATVNEELANEILDRAKYYCPKHNGTLVNSGKIETMPNGEYMVVFDCNYAWYVHEFTWISHDYPTCAKFLTLAKQEIYALHNLSY